MRSAASKADKKPTRTPRTPPKKKKLSDLRSPVRDTITETISFVIKGELTPIKPAPILKNIVKTSKVCKTRLRRVPPKDTVTEKSTKRLRKASVTPPKNVVAKKNVGNKKDVTVKKKVQNAKSKVDIKIKKQSNRAKCQTKPKVVCSNKVQKTPVKKCVKKVKKVDEKIRKESAEDEIKKRETIEKLLKEAKNEVLKTRSVKKNKPKILKTKEISSSSDKSDEVKIKKEKIEEEIKNANISEQKITENIPEKEKPLEKTEKSTESSSKSSNLKDSNSKDSNSKEDKLTDVKVKEEPSSDSDPKRKTPRKQKVIKSRKDRRNSKLFSFWNGPKRHRVASLNALAKVHCLYENEGKGNIIDKLEDKAVIKLKKEISEDETKSEKSNSPPPTRTLRSVPGLRAVGKHWDMHDTTSSSEDESETSVEVEKTKIKKEPVVKSNVSKEKSQNKEKQKKSTANNAATDQKKQRRRRRTELMMDLKDMVVRKRMASLNASAILAASYSVEKKAFNSKSTGDSSYDSDSSDAYFALSSDKEDEPKKPKLEEEIKQEDQKLIELHATPNKKVAVILNQDTDVTITGVYVNSTTRSTHHEGFCSIAGMRYRISATSHTQTATETLVQGENANVDAPPAKSYTPLAALSSMQPPAGPGLLTPPPGRGQSAPGGGFSSPPPFGGGATHAEAGYSHGYYQPAGPLITVPHGHAPPAKLAEDPPPPTTAPPPPPSADSSDSEVIITSVTAGPRPAEPLPQAQPQPAYRYQYPAQYPYPYAAYHYATPPPPPPPPPNPPYHEMCYAKYPPVGYGRYLGPYYQEYAGGGQGGQGGQQKVLVKVVPAAPASSSGAGAGYAPPTALLEPYPTAAAPPPGALVDAYQPQAHYYPPPAHAYALPGCYAHAGAARPPTMPYIDATAYQACPCPMRSCPKNGMAAPLTGGGGKRPEAAAPPPVALAAAAPDGAAGPPSPARGSAGAPPPPSPAVLAAYHPPPPQQQDKQDGGGVVHEVKRRARVGKAMVRNNIQQNTMLLMCNTNQNHIKREIESPKEKDEQKKEFPSSDEEQLTKNIEKTEPTTPVDSPNVIILKNESVTPEAKTQQTDIPLEEEEEEEIVEREREPEVEKEVDELELELEFGVTEMDASCNNNNNNNDLEEVEMSKNEEPNNNDNNFEKSDESLLPCTVTVAENVKVKNMKRKASLCKEDDPPPPKKQNTNTGSYKNHIRKLSHETNCKNTQNKVKTKRKENKKTKPLQSSNRQDAIDKTIELVVAASQKKPARISKTTETIPKKRRRNSKNEPIAEAVPKVPRRSLLAPRWSNGWRWEGEPHEGRVFLNSDETAAIRKCYPAMRHEEGDILLPKDCVLLKAGPRKNDLPYVAKIAYLWENPDDGEMMMSLLWYYRPEHTEQGRQPYDQPDEVFASRHKDSNSVACIDDKCYVLTFNEYCRYKKRSRLLEEGPTEEKPPCIPAPETYPRQRRQPPGCVSPEMVFFCRKVYDFRQKRIVKNPT